VVVDPRDFLPDCESLTGQPTEFTSYS